MTSVICICNKRACDRQRQSYGERMVVISSWAPVVSVGTHRQNTQRAQFCGASEFYGHRHQSVYQTAQTDTRIHIYFIHLLLDEMARISHVDWEYDVYIWSGHMTRSFDLWEAQTTKKVWPLPSLPAICSLTIKFIGNRYDINIYAINTRIDWIEIEIEWKFNECFCIQSHGWKQRYIRCLIF